MANIGEQNGGGEQEGERYGLGDNDERSVRVEVACIPGETAAEGGQIEGCRSGADYPRQRRPRLSRAAAVAVQQMAALGAHRSELERHPVQRLFLAGSIARPVNGKNRNVAVTCVAHRLAQIIWLLLKEQRPYTETAPKRGRRLSRIVPNPK